MDNELIEPDKRFVDFFKRKLELYRTLISELEALAMDYAALSEEQIERAQKIIDKGQPGLKGYGWIIDDFTIEFTTEVERILRKLIAGLTTHQKSILIDKEIKGFSNSFLQEVQKADSESAKDSHYIQ